MLFRFFFSNDELRGILVFIFFYFCDVYKQIRPGIFSGPAEVKAAWAVEKMMTSSRIFVAWVETGGQVIRSVYDLFLQYLNQMKCN